LINVRLAGYDCPEANRGSDNERAKAKEARYCADSFFRGLRDGHLMHTDFGPVGTFWIQTQKDPDNFGRWLGDIWLEMVDTADIHLGKWLHNQQLASEWPTRWRDNFEHLDAIPVEAP
jgi:hypothetical protein